MIHDPIIFDREHYDVVPATFALKIRGFQPDACPVPPRQPSAAPKPKQPGGKRA